MKKIQMFVILAALVLLAQTIAVVGLESSTRAKNRGGVSISDEPVYTPRATEAVEKQGVVLPDFKPVSAQEKRGYVKIKPNPSDVAKDRANTNAAFKRSSSAEETKGIIDPLFKTTKKITGAVGLESSMKNPAKHSMQVKISTIKLTERGNKRNN